MKALRLLLTLFASLTATPVAAEDLRPNILVLLADDLGWRDPPRRHRSREPPHAHRTSTAWPARA
jgi:hypothetical protein